MHYSYLMNSARGASLKKRKKQKQKEEMQNMNARRGIQMFT